ncbi:hypothetical protein [Povalibacter sp.]|uniref:hypothetical protein n=1 Tax=Povalibacter sp. TaxID=1962978 RepID=UPI002F4293D5
MTTYELLDCIADSVNPTLGLLALSVPWLRDYRIQRPSSGTRIAGAVMCVGIAYVGQAIDRFTGIWPALGLDYSAHSAVCVALLVSLGHLSGRWRLASVGVGAAYAAVMMYQGYHTFADIVTTAMPIGLACMVVWRCRLLRDRPTRSMR